MQQLRRGGRRFGASGQAGGASTDFVVGRRVVWWCAGTAGRGSQGAGCLWRDAGSLGRLGGSPVEGVRRAGALWMGGGRRVRPDLLQGSAVMASGELASVHRGDARGTGPAT